MVLKNFLKRSLPFAVALLVGIFVASFFVGISAPSFPLKKREVKSSCWNQHKKIKMEKMRERERREQLRKQSLEEMVPPPPPIPALAPPAPSN